MDIDDDLIYDPELGDAVPAKDSVRRVMNLYYLIDTSGSMSGDRINTVNQVMPEVVKIVGEISDSNADTAEIKVSCLTFDDNVKWMYSGPVAANEFKWLNRSTNGCTELGAAYTELEKHLHRGVDLSNEQGNFAPAIILITDGAPTDNHKAGLEKLKKNNWFLNSIRVAIAIGTGTDNAVLRAFVGGEAPEKRVITVHDKDALKEMIKLVSASVSKIGSANSSTGQQTKDDELTETITESLPENFTIDNDGAIDIPPLGDDIFD